MRIFGPDVFGLCKVVALSELALQRIQKQLGNRLKDLIVLDVSKFCMQARLAPDVCLLAELCVDVVSGALV